MRKVVAICLFALMALPSFGRDVGPEQTVLQLYKAFAWEAVISEPGVSLVDQPESVLRRYFTPELAAALRADAQCSIRTHDVCALDFSPIWDSQDPGAFDLKVSKLGPGRVRVEFKTPPAGEAVNLEYRLVKRGHDWRVSDILYPEGRSLRALLSHGQ